ncbi:MAG: RNA polymerase factor sigma-54 [Gemmataceae bacterium]|nr:RNA polymerase factor sigma-54 [Gemmataceae bacterium]
MSLGMQIRTDQRMVMQLAPRMIQSMEILQLPIMALQERIQQELQENPVLELKETTPEEAAAANEEEGGEATTATLEAEDAKATDGELVIDQAGDELDFNRLDALSRDWEDHFNEEHRPSRNGLDDEGDKKHDAEVNIPSRPPSLHDHLLNQLGFLDYESEQRELLQILISHIDDHGYFKTPLEDISRLFTPPLEVSEVEDALRLIQKLDPPGVGARDYKECLFLQVTDDTPHRDVVRTLILHHMEDIAHNRLPVIQRRTGFDIALIKEGIEEVKRLNIHPGAAFDAENTAYVVPDIIVERAEDGEYTVRLVDDWVPNIYISRKYIDLYRDKASDPKAKEYLKRKIQAAQWLLDSIEQRRNTLEKVTRAIIQHQRAFLDKGPEHIEPLKMQQIADLVGVHVTTVSRAVDDKWVQTPRGVFPLKRFFGGGTQTTSGEEVAWETIKQKLMEIIDGEDKSDPLSDEHLVVKLQEAGYPIKRRTVTKYRKMGNIPSSRQRKDWALKSATP